MKSIDVGTPKSGVRGANIVLSVAFVCSLISVLACGAALIWLIENCGNYLFR